MLRKSPLFCLLLIITTISSTSADKIIIDTDAGSDDALAILLLLRAEQQRLPPYRHEVIAITCTYGNTKEKNVEVNVLKTLTIANRSDIPVYGGAEKPLIEKFKTDNYFGEDGFGDIEFPHKIIGTVNKSAHASVALVELTKKHQDVSIIVLGPTTNVALAASLDPDFVKRVKKFYVMGSSVAGVGNLRPNVEFNFAADPEANYILLNSTKEWQLTLFPWEAGYEAKLSKEWRRQKLGTFKSPYIDFLNKVEEFGISNSKEKNYIPIDGMTVATVIWPKIINSTFTMNVEPVVSGQARGSVLVDYLRLSGVPPNSRIVRTILPELFKELLLFYLSCEFIPC